MQQKDGHRAESLLQSVTAVITLTVVCRLVGFCRGVFLARTLEPDELGMWALLSNAIVVLAFVCTLGVPNGLARYTERYRREGKLLPLFATTLWRTLAIAAGICLLGLVFWEPIGGLLFSSSASRAIVWITLATVLITVVLSLGQGMLHGLRLFRASSLFDLAQNVAFLGLAVLLLSLWRSDAYVAAWAHLLTTLLVAGGIGYWLYRSLQRPDHLDSTVGLSSSSVAWWPIVAYSLGAWSAGSLQSLWRVIDRYMLLHLSSSSTAQTLDQIGQYFVAAKLSQPLGALAGILSVALLPHAARLWEKNRRAEVAEMIRSITKYSALAMTFVGAVLVVCKPLLIQLVTGRSAGLASAVFAPVLVTVVIVSVHFILRTYLLCRERTWAISGVWLVTLLANAALNGALIPYWGLIGAAWATLISAALVVGLVVWLSARSGMSVDLRSGCCLVLPAVLLLPPPLLLLALALISVTIYFSDVLISAAEKSSINQWCVERCATGLGERVGLLLALRS